MIDYERLFKKYVAWVGICNHVDYINTGIYDYCGEYCTNRTSGLSLEHFTVTEWAELKDASSKIEAENRECWLAYLERQKQSPESLETFDSMLPGVGI